MKCPACGSEKIQFGTNTSSGGFSAKNGCCGYMLLGPLGLLCGACGSATKTEEFWVCQNCGKRFTAEEANRAMQRINEMRMSSSKEVVSGCEPASEKPDTAENKEITEEAASTSVSETAAVEKGNVIAYAVILKVSSAQKLGLIKVICEITNASLTDAKDFVEKTPSRIKYCETREEAQFIVDRLNAEGAHAEIMEIYDEE